MDSILESFKMPPEVGEIIPALRSALAIHDPEGLAAQPSGKPKPGDGIRSATIAMPGLPTRSRAMQKRCTVC